MVFFVDQKSTSKRVCLYIWVWIIYCAFVFYEDFLNAFLKKIPFINMHDIIMQLLLFLTCIKMVGTELKNVHPFWYFFLIEWIVLRAFGGMSKKKIDRKGPISKIWKFLFLWLLFFNIEFEIKMNMIIFLKI